MPLPPPPTAPPAASADLFCLRCGYNQRGHAAERCPECGASHADSPPSPVRLPWAHRRHLGWFRAYWRTVMLACFRPSRIVAEVEHPVTLADGHAFRQMTILHVLAPLVVLGAFVYVDGMGTSWGQMKRGWFNTEYIPLWPILPVLVGAWGFVYVAASAPGEFARSSRLDTTMNIRAVALSYYACAPLAFMPLATALATLLPVVEFGARSLTWMVSLPLVATMLLIGVGWWYRSVSIPGRMTGRRMRHSILVGAALPLIWLVQAVVMLVIVPLVLYITAAGAWSMLSGMRG